MYIRPLCLLVFAIKISVSSAQTCDNVRNLVVHYVIDPYPASNLDNVTVTGCISDATFKPKIVNEISITCGTAIVPKLQTKFIADMERLQSISIDSCHINAIEPETFSNLPRLRSLAIEGNPLTKITYGVFNVLPSLVKLNIHFNKISYIEDRAFANLPNLEYFSLRKNRLNQLNPEWFRNTSNIKRFDADQNLLRHIPSGMFRGWKNLIHLNLMANSISQIDDGTFNDTAPAMELLGLHQNLLTSISPKIFSSSLFIRDLIISANLLNYLSDDFLKNINVDNLFIFGNPFTCPCLKRIYKILEEQDVIADKSKTANYFDNCSKINYVPVCGYSAKYPNTCVYDMDKEVTRQVITVMKGAGYNNRRSLIGYQCAMFNYE